MRKKEGMALFLAGVLVFSSGLSIKINREKSRNFASLVSSFAESIDDDDFNIVAHRGFSSLEVENTKEAFSLAAEKNYVDFIEIDARLTRDGKIVLSHNDSLFVSPDFTQEVSGMTYEDALNQTFYYGTFPYNSSILNSREKNFLIGRYVNLMGREFQLSDLLEGIQSCGDKKILIDLKFHYDIPQFVDELIKELQGVDTSSIVFQSLDIYGIRYLRDHSDFECLALLDSKSDLKYIDEFDSVGIKSSLLSPEVLEKVISGNKKLALWTIDSTEELNRVVSILGEYYQDVLYITDYPDLIVKDLHAVQLKKEK